MLFMRWNAMYTAVSFDHLRFNNHKKNKKQSLSQSSHFLADQYICTTCCIWNTGQHSQHDKKMNK